MSDHAHRALVSSPIVPVRGRANVLRFVGAATILACTLGTPLHAQVPQDGASPSGPPPGSGAPNFSGPPPGAPPGAPPPGAPSAGPGGPPPLPPEEAAKVFQKIMDEKAPHPVVPLPPPPSNLKNFEGTWIGNELPSLRYSTSTDGEAIATTPVGEKTFEDRVNATYVKKAPPLNAASYCLPAGTIWQIGVLYPFQIYQTPTTLTLLGSEYHTVWNVRINGKHRVTGPREYNGDAIGHWEGDTLVIDTTRFKDSLWIDSDGHAASRDAHLTYRLRRIGDAHNILEIVTTIDDPVNYTKPWSIRHTYQYRPDMEFFAEYDCETQVNGPQGPTPSGPPAHP